MCNYIAVNHNGLQTHLETHSLNPPSIFAVPQHRRHGLRPGPPAEHAEAPGEPGYGHAPRPKAKAQLRNRTARSRENHIDE